MERAGGPEPGAGVWLIFSPYILDYAMSSIAWNDLIVGFGLVAVACWECDASAALETPVVRGTALGESCYDSH